MLTLLITAITTYFVIYNITKDKDLSFFWTVITTILSLVVVLFIPSDYEEKVVTTPLIELSEGEFVRGVSAGRQGYYLYRTTKSNQILECIWWKVTVKIGETTPVVKEVSYHRKTTIKNLFVLGYIPDDKLVFIVPKI